MIQGPIYFHLRSSLLSSYPPGCRASLERTLTLPQWFQRGAYTVSSVTNTDIVITAAPIDVASAMITDIELFSNACFEHLQELLSFSQDTRPRSDAWNVVAIYYFSYFAAQVFLRLIGRPVMFLNKDTIRDIKRLSRTTATSRLGAGTFLVSKIADVSLSQADYRITRSDKKPHEATWKTTFAYLDDLCRNPSIATDAAELLFYKLLTTKSLFGVYTDYEWPSLVRNKANYSPGFAYRHLQGVCVGRAKHTIDAWKIIDSSTLVRHMQSAEEACDRSETDFAAHVRLLHDISQGLFLLSRQLYSELLDRKGLDPRWEQMRSKYRSRMSMSEGEFSLYAPGVSSGDSLFSRTHTS